MAPTLANSWRGIRDSDGDYCHTVGMNFHVMELSQLGVSVSVTVMCRVN